MAHVIAPNLRGKGVSETKFTKSGQPKRSGNWSAATIHYQSLKSKDYPVWVKEFESGIKILVVGEKTPLPYIMGEKAMTLALGDPHFDSYRRSGEKTVGNKPHEAHMTLTKSKIKYYIDKYRWGTLRMEIYTDGDFDFEFPEY